MVDSVDQSVGPPLRRARGAGRGRQHDLRLPLRQRRLPRGRGRRAPRRTSAPWCRRTSPTWRTTSSTGAASTWPAAPAPWCTTRGAGPWRRTRRSASTRSTPTPAATRCRSSSTGRSGHAGAGLRDQWAHVTDLLPTLCELSRRRPGPASATASPLQPLNGRSLGAGAGRRRRRPPPRRPVPGDGRPPRLLRRRLGDRHPPPAAHRVRRPRVGAVPPGRATAPRLRDLAAEHPERVAEMAAAWEAAARANQVYPLDEGSRLRYVVRPALRPAAAGAGAHRGRHPHAGALPLPAC